MLCVSFLLDVSVFVLLINCQCFGKRMTDLQSQTGLEIQGNLEVARSVILSKRDIRAPAASFPFFTVSEATGVVEGQEYSPTKVDFNLPTPPFQKGDGSLASSNNHKDIYNHNNNNSTTIVSMMSSSSSNEGAAVAVASARDTLVVMITLTIIFFTLVATYFLWRKHRSRIHLSSSGGGGSSHSVYMYSRLSQNDVEVDNISFQGDLTHKALVHPVVPVAQSCAEEESCDDDQVQPATLCLEYDALVTISNQDDNSESCGNQRNKKPSINRRHSSVAIDNPPVNLLIDELSDEQDLLQ